MQGSGLIVKKKKETKGEFVGPLWIHFCLGDAPLTCDFDSCEDCPDATELGELKACVHTDSVAQLVAQDALLAVIGQF